MAAVLRASRMLRLSVLENFFAGNFETSEDGTCTPRVKTTPIAHAPLPAITPVSALDVQSCTGRLRARVNSDLQMSPAPPVLRRTDTSALIDVSFTLRRAEAAPGVDAIDAALCRILTSAH